MKAILTKIFVTLGVIFTLLLIVVAYFFIADPYNLRPILFGAGGGVQTSLSSEVASDALGDAGASTTTPLAGTGFTLSSPQRQALIEMGIDPSSVPTQVSVQQETCFVEMLGADRVKEIKAGAVPNGIELLKAKSCI